MNILTINAMPFKSILVVTHKFRISDEDTERLKEEDIIEIWKRNYASQGERYISYKIDKLEGE